MTPAPARRSDASRNRERILDAARAAFADPGADVSMIQIARRAGVGSATLYRNFASRRELLETLYVGEIDALCDAAAALEAASPGERLVEWLRRFYGYFTSKRLVAAELLQQVDADAPVFGAGYTRVVATGRGLLEAAQSAGEVRTSLTIEQALDMVGAIAKIPGDDAYRAPILDAALGALRAC